MARPPANWYPDPRGRHELRNLLALVVGSAVGVDTSLNNDALDVG